MSDRARNYVKKLDNARVPGTLKALLFFIADYHDVARGCAWPGIQTVADDTGKSVRQVQRLLKQGIELGIISYEHGEGRGRLGRFIFTQLEKGDAGVTVPAIKDDAKGDIKGDIFDSAIRKEPEPGTINQNSKQHTRSRALTAWMAVKYELKAELPETEWFWLRPLLLLRELDHNFLLLALPTNARIMSAAEKGKALLRERLKTHGYTCSYTRYPDDYELEKLREGGDPGWVEVANRLKKPPRGVSA